MPKDRVGEIDIYDKFTFVDVDADSAKQLIKRLKRIKGRKVKVEVSNPRK